MRIVFVRHGEPDYTRDCLTEPGKMQAKACAERLRSEGIEEIWSSPLGRAAETAAVTAETLHLPVRTLDYMRELHWGSINGEPLPSDGHPWELADRLAGEGWDLTDLRWREHPSPPSSSAVWSFPPAGQRPAGSTARPSRAWPRPS